MIKKFCRVRIRPKLHLGASHPCRHPLNNVATSLEMPNYRLKLIIKGHVNLSIIGIKSFMSKIDIITPRTVVYKVENSGTCMGPCGTPLYFLPI